MAQVQGSPHQGLLVITMSKGAASSALTGETWGRPCRPGTGRRDGVIGNPFITGQGKVCPYGGWTA